VSDRSITQRTLDALVYAPAGLVLTALEDLPEMAAKGRSRIEVQVRNAHLVGQVVVDHGLGGLLGGGRQTAGRAAPPAPPTPTPPAPGGRESARGLAIPDYDTLSASQVVQRLDGLDRRELVAVVDHETATRGRRTILHRAQQLLGSEEPPGAP
jgi:hypothetical protein